MHVPVFQYIGVQLPNLAELHFQLFLPLPPPHWLNNAPQGSFQNDNECKGYFDAGLISYSSVSVIRVLKMTYEPQQYILMSRVVNLYNYMYRQDAFISLALCIYVREGTHYAETTTI